VFEEPSFSLSSLRNAGVPVVIIVGNGGGGGGGPQPEGGRGGGLIGTEYTGGGPISVSDEDGWTTW